MTDNVMVRHKRGTAKVWRFQPGICTPPGFEDRPVQGIYWAPSSSLSPTGRTRLVMNLPSGPKDVNEGDYVLRFEDGSYDVLTPAQFLAEYEVVPGELCDPFALQLTLSMGRFAVFQATYDSIVAALRDRGDKHMAEMLDNAWFIAFGDALGTPKATAPEGGTQ